MAMNVDYDKINISYVQNDTLDMTYQVKRNNVLLDMTGMSIDIEVKDKNNNLIASLTTGGVSPSIVISTTSFTMYKTNFITTVGKYYYDIQLTNGMTVSTICRGYFKVLSEYTD